MQNYSVFLQDTRVGGGGSEICSKSRSHLQIQGTRKVTRSKFRTGKGKDEGDVYS